MKNPWNVGDVVICTGTRTGSYTNFLGKVTEVIGDYVNVDFFQDDGDWRVQTNLYYWRFRKPTKLEKALL